MANIRNLLELSTKFSKKNFNYKNKTTSKNLTKFQIFIRNQQETTIGKYKNKKKEFKTPAFFNNNNNLKKLFLLYFPFS